MKIYRKKQESIKILQKGEKITFWNRYLIVVGVLLFVTGLWIVYFKNTWLFDLFVKSVETVFWPDPLAKVRRHVFIKTCLRTDSSE